MYTKLETGILSLNRNSFSIFLCLHKSLEFLSQALKLIKDSK